VIRLANLLPGALHRSRKALARMLDGHPRRGNFEQSRVGYDTSIQKEILSRDVILGRAGEGMRFLDVGGGDGSLTYLLGVRPGLNYDAELHAQNGGLFEVKYEYYGIDLRQSGKPRTIVGDICDPALVGNNAQFGEFFDVIYSNNAFEHFASPWIAAENIVAMLKPGGVCVIIAPFSLRYHEVPGDYFRFTHTGLASLFERVGGMRLLVSGYDTHDRRVNWQGIGEANDICPTDEFGAWRENWFVVAILEKCRDRG
jgi:SAM-dependent methyltransferase